MRGRQPIWDKLPIGAIRALYNSGLTQKELAERFSVAPRTMAKACRQAGIVMQHARRCSSESAAARAQHLAPILRRLYLTEAQSTNAIAQQLGLSQYVVWKYLGILGIPLRGTGDHKRRPKGLIALGGPLGQILSGELLGDGCLCKPSYNAYFGYTTSRGRYLKWLVALMGEHGVTGSSINYGVTKDRRRTKQTPTVRWASHSYPEFTRAYHRWYPDGSKRVPEDLALTPTVCRHWYIGDGTLMGHKSPYISIATRGFPRTDTALLVSLLGRLGMRCRVLSTGDLGLPAEAARRFLEYIGPCPPAIDSVYGYKWELTRFVA